MKSDNQYLKGIAKNTGSNVDGHHTDNYYLKRIEENTKSGSSSGGSGGSGFSGDFDDLTNVPHQVSLLAEIIMTDLTAETIKVTYMDDTTENMTLLRVRK